MEKSRFLGSYWILIWRRKHGEYYYYNDSVRLELDETYGLYSYINACNSKTPTTVEVKITKEKAQELALQYVKKIMKKFFNNEFQVEKALAHQLYIINPNYILSDTWPLRQSREARLGWEVICEASYFEFYVWIDAATGELLGGDYKQVEKKEKK